MMISGVPLSVVFYGVVFVGLPLLLIYYDRTGPVQSASPGAKRLIKRFLFALMILGAIVFTAPHIKQSNLEQVEKTLIESRHGFENFMNKHFGGYLTGLLESDTMQALKKALQSD